MAKDNLDKSLSLPAPPRFVINPIPGQVPNRDRIEALRLAKEMPAKYSVGRLLQHDGAYLSPVNVVDGIGLDRVKQQEWIGHLNKAVRSTNELTFRQDIMGKMLHDRMDGATRQALFQRAMGFYRDMRKSMVSITTPDELRKASGLGDDEPALQNRLRKSIVRRVDRHGGRLPLADLDDLIRRYGRRAVADTLQKACTDRGGLSYRDGVLIKR